MAHKDRIQRMLEEGILTGDQAAVLQRSLERAPIDTPRPARRRSPLLIGWVVIGLALLVALFWGAGDEQVVQNVAETMNQPGVVGMNKGISSLLGIALLLVVPLLIWMWLHNQLVSREESAHSAWAQVESNYQRRSDLIPRLVETVSRYLKHESDTLTGVVDARDPMDEAIAQLIDAQERSAEQLRSIGDEPPSDSDQLRTLHDLEQQVGLGMRRIVALVENYPALRSADQFLELQAQLEGTENRINVARMRFNEAVRDYNAATRRLPGSLVATVGGFQRKAYFEADDGAQTNKPLDID